MAIKESFANGTASQPSHNPHDSAEKKLIHQDINTLLVRIKLRGVNVTEEKCEAITQDLLALLYGTEIHNEGLPQKESLASHTTSQGVESETKFKQGDNSQCDSITTEMTNGSSENGSSEDGSSKNHSLEEKLDDQTGTPSNDKDEMSNGESKSSPPSISEQEEMNTSSTQLADTLKASEDAKTSDDTLQSDCESDIPSKQAEETETSTASGCATEDDSHVSEMLQHQDVNYQEDTTSSSLPEYCVSNESSLDSNTVTTAASLTFELTSTQDKTTCPEELPDSPAVHLSSSFCNTSSNSDQWDTSTCSGSTCSIHEDAPETAPPSISNTGNSDMAQPRYPQLYCEPPQYSKGRGSLPSLSAQRLQKSRSRQIENETNFCLRCDYLYDRQPIHSFTSLLQQEHQELRNQTLEHYMCH
ncbi:uncharacterized protein LOC134191434 isoform X2 [Corticium candelabrum]|nr:uncharacterized protein LOC134191434 isoform X2 [Corticium candelabrum]